MEISGYVRGIPTYEDLNGKTYGMLCETKEKCITDDTGVALDFKLEELQKQIEAVVEIQMLPLWKGIMRHILQRQRA